MNADNFHLGTLISSMKDLRRMSLGDQIRQALQGEKIGLDPAALAELVRELETDIEEHIERLERIAGAMTEPERHYPERMEPERRAEVAFKAGCDIEEVDSICDAFSRAREILAGQATGGVIDLKLLFSNIPGFAGFEVTRGPDGVPKVPAQIIEEALGARGLAPRKPQTDTDLEALFDLEKTAAPRNRLPRDWKP
ncbi:MAG: hypothetical protein HS108_05920 [Planctomycetes bacterium]|nr:hypothetical protein [Planctomycetota bacterium]MCL4731231.1 hypothetical protein [Planctomycetota bacterium]